MKDTDKMPNVQDKKGYLFVRSVNNFIIKYEMLVYQRLLLPISLLEPKSIASCKTASSIITNYIKITSYLCFSTNKLKSTD